MVALVLALLALVAAFVALVAAFVALVAAASLLVTHSPATVFVSLTNVSNAPNSASDLSLNVDGSALLGAVGSADIVVITFLQSLKLLLSNRNTLHLLPSPSDNRKHSTL